LIAAADFFTTEVWTARGLVTHYTPAVIDIASRGVQIVGTTTNPVSAWMEQIARNLTDWEDGFLIGKRFLIIDRDCIFSPGFKSIIEGSGTKILLTSYQAPNMNAHAERFVRSIKSEGLDRMSFVWQQSLDRALKEYVEHYRDERSHQGIGNRLVSGAEPQRHGPVTARRRLCGMLTYYHRRAA
jgi:transposase InsO family protein